MMGIMNWEHPMIRRTPMTEIMVKNMDRIGLEELQDCIGASIMLGYSHPEP